MRTYLTYSILGIIGFILLKLTQIELNGKLIAIALISIPIIEYIINIKYHRINALKERMKKMSKAELDALLGDKPLKRIEEYSSTLLTNPQSFGFKTNWIVIPSNDIDKVLKEFNYSKQVRTNWQIGVNAIYENMNLKFISPVINNWVFVINYSFEYINSDKTISKLKDLSRKFGEAYFFGSFRGTGFASWAKYVNGDEIRAFLIDDGDVFYSQGELEELESKIISERKKKLNIEDKEEMEYYQEHNFVNLLGDEDDVLLMAKKWTINPMDINLIENKEFGYLIE